MPGMAAFLWSAFSTVDQLRGLEGDEHPPSENCVPFECLNLKI